MKMKNEKRKVKNNYNFGSGSEKTVVAES